MIAVCKLAPVISLLGLSLHASAAERRAQASQFIKMTPPQTDLDMFYSLYYEGRAYIDLDFTIRNEGRSTEIVDFRHLERYLKVVGVAGSSDRSIHPLVNRSERVAQTDGYTGSGASGHPFRWADHCRVFFDLAKTGGRFEMSRLSLPSSVSAELVLLKNLEVAIIEIDGTDDPSGVVSELKSIGIAAEADLSIKLTGEEAAPLPLLRRELNQRVMYSTQMEASEMMSESVALVREGEALLADARVLFLSADREPTRKARDAARAALRAARAAFSAAKVAEKIALGQFEEARRRPLDPLVGRQWALPDLCIDQVLYKRISRTLTIDGNFDWKRFSKVPVAVIDSGIDYEHPELRRVVVNNGWEDWDHASHDVDDDHNGFVDDVRGWNFVDNDANVMDSSGHGTHVAGVLAAEGYNKDGIIGSGFPFARVLPLKIFKNGRYGRLSDAFKAFDYAVEQGVMLSSNSWYTTAYSAVFAKVIDRLADHGHLVIAGAGNDGDDLDETGASYPCGFAASNVLCVGAHGKGGNRMRDSNYGPGVVDVSAPGHNIFSTALENGYRLMSGTSMAAAQVAGVAALLVGARKPFPLRYDEVVAAITDTAKVNGWTTFGRVDACGALESVVDDIEPLTGAVSIVSGYHDRQLETLRLGPGERHSLKLRLYSPPEIGHHEYDLIGPIGQGVLDIHIRLRRRPPQGWCAVSGNGFVVNFGTFVLGSSRTVSFNVFNIGGGKLELKRSRLDPWAPELTVVNPVAESVVLSTMEYIEVVYNFKPSSSGVFEFYIDGLHPTCDRPGLYARVIDSLAYVESPTEIPDWLPLGLRHLPLSVAVVNPTILNLRTQVVIRSEPYILEGPVAGVSFPFLPVGGGWVSMMAVEGQQILFNCTEGQHHSIVLPRPFPFYSERSTEVAVGCNGVAYVASMGEGREPPRLPRLSSGSGIIAPYWVESSKARCPDTSGCRISFVVRETNTSSTLIVEWRNLLVEANTTAGSVVMQLHVHTDGRLVFLYKTIPVNHHRRDLAVGIGSADGFEGRNIMRDLNGTDPLAVVWTPRLRSSPVMLPANSTTVVEFQLSTPFLGLPGGDAVCEETGWVDAFNRTCADYVAKALCTEDGTPGIGWDSSLGSFAQAAFTTPADVSCCGCGGGTWTRDPSEGAPWQDTLVLGLKDVDDERGSFSRTITGSAELDVLLDGDEELVPYDGGLRILRVIAQDPSRSVNVKESGLTVTIDLFVSGILHSSKNVVLVGGQGTAEFDIPSGPTSVTARATPSIDIVVEQQIVTCGGDDVVGVNGLRYLLWSGLTGELVCALLKYDGDSWLAANGSSLSPTPAQGWYSIAMADSSGRIVAAVDASPRRVGEVLLGFESSIAFGGCGGFCVSAGTINVDFGTALRESLIRVLREEGSETTEDEDGRGGTVITTTTSTDRSAATLTTTPTDRSADIFTTTPTDRSADIFTTTPTDRSADIFTIAVSTTPNSTMSVPVYLDCDAGCWADHPGSYCKYWLTPSVCYVSGKPCRCAHSQGR